MSDEAGPLRALILEDDPADAELVRRELERALDVRTTVVGDREGFLAAIEDRPDVILADYNMQGFSGLEALELARARDPDIPFLLVSGSIGEEAALEAVKRGLTDYIWKDRRARLVPAVERALTERREKVDRRRLEGEVSSYQRRVAELMEEMPAAFVSLDRSLRFVYTNRTAARLLGREAADLVGMPLGEVAPELHPLERRRVPRSGVTDGPILRELFLSGPGRWFDVHAYPTPAGFSVYFRDVTEDRDARERLRATEERYRAVVDALPVITYMDPLPGGRERERFVSPQCRAILGVTQAEWIEGEGAWRTMLHPEDRRRVLALNRRSERALSPFDAEYRMIARDGREVWIADRGVVVEDERGDPWMHGVMVDVTERKAVERALERRDRILQITADATDRLLRAEGWEDEVDQWLERLGVAAEAVRAMVVHVVEGDGGALATVTHEWAAPGMDRIGPSAGRFPVPASGGYARRLERLRSGEVVLGPVPGLSPGERPAPDRRGIASLIAAPLLPGGTFEGYVVFGRSQPGSWEAPVADALRVATNALASAADRRGVFTALRRTDAERRTLLSRLVSAHEDERYAIANDIHDDTIQVMTAVEMRLSMLKRKLSEGDPEGEDAVDIAKLQSIVQEAIERLRNLLFELRPPALDRDGLVPALRDYVARMFGPDDPVVAFEDQPRTREGPDVRVLLYRLAQEALTNARKHARAAHVRVLVESKRRGVRVFIRDDGIGFDPAALPANVPGHLGILSMRERAELAGGWFRVSGRPGQGTEVEAWVPSDGAAAPG